MRPAPLRPPVPPAPLTIKIYVSQDSQTQKWKIDCFPKRWSESVIYFTPGNKRQNPSLPREVVWEVSGLATGQAVELVPKSTSKAKQPLTAPGRITSSSPSRRTARVGPNFRPGHRVDAWQYSIVLRDRNGKLDTIDPEIIIKEDP